MRYVGDAQVGTALGKSLVARWVDPAGAAAAAAATTAPSLTLPKAVGSLLPGRLYGMYVSTPSVAAQADGPAQLRRVTSNSNGHLEMCLDGDGRIAAILYCGQRRIDVARLACIMGLPATYLDDVESKVAAGQVRSQITLQYPTRGFLPS